MIINIVIILLIIYALIFAIIDHFRIKKMVANKELKRAYKIQPRLSEYKHLDVYITNSLVGLLVWIVLNCLSVEISYPLSYFLALLSNFAEDFWYAILFKRREFYK